MDKPLIHHDKGRKQDRGEPIKCRFCGTSGDTLAKDDKGYYHTNVDRCRMMQLRRKT